MLTLLAGKEILQKAVYYKSMASDQRALASIEIDLADVPEGKVTFYKKNSNPKNGFKNTF